MILGFGLASIELTGDAWNDSFTDPRAYVGRIVIVGVRVLVAGIAGYVIAQRRHGAPFRWREREPAVLAEAASAPAR